MVQALVIDIADRPDLDVRELAEGLHVVTKAATGKPHNAEGDLLARGDAGAPLAPLALPPATAPWVCLGGRRLHTQPRCHRRARGRLQEFPSSDLIRHPQPPVLTALRRATGHTFGFRAGLSCVDAAYGVRNNRAGWHVSAGEPMGDVTHE